MKARLQPRRAQRGGFVLGAVVGLLVGLVLALGVALYITKAPVPFVNKVPQRTVEQDEAEQQRNRNWDPNAPLGGRRPAVTGSAPAQAASVAGADTSGAAAPPPVAPASAPGRSRDPAAILAGSETPGSTRPGSAAPAPTASAPRGAEPFVFFVQAGAYTRTDEAEQQRARLGMMGLTARITEREQSGRVVYRVRVGPFEGRPEAEGLQRRLQEASIDSQLVRVERP